ncbi:hypothetical protein GIB67_025883 [Kingdonia uniflora]|uniref:Amino acid transporter transmembrane domain-containing protein n=1 Tax=Kingdonia uniflora TaxID=39325 RepID=A0A7J7LXN1_9MAGN|nr:hypothetical protein GIB67_025883 [Kingdonia uniflora]
MASEKVVEMEPEEGNNNNGSNRSLSKFFWNGGSVYDAWFSRASNQIEGVKHSGPVSMVLYFTGATNILYTFGGHAVTVEIMHAMWKPQKFKLLYLIVTVYVLTLTLPSATAVYWAFGGMLLNHSNAFALLPRSGFRDTAVILMLIHQVVVERPPSFIGGWAGLYSMNIFVCYVTGVHYLLLLLPETAAAVLVLSVVVANETAAAVHKIKLLLLPYTVLNQREEQTELLLLPENIAVATEVLKFDSNKPSRFDGLNPQGSGVCSGTRMPC